MVAPYKNDHDCDPLLECFPDIPGPRETPSNEEEFNEH